MPTLTAPLLGVQAHGTLTGQLTYRRRGAATIATRMPRHPHAIPQALRANALLVRAIHVHVAAWSLLPDILWTEEAKAKRVTPTNLIIRDCIADWKASRGMRTYANAPNGGIAPPTPEIAAQIRPGSTTPVIADTGAMVWDYLSIHRSTAAAAPATLDTLIAVLTLDVGPVEVEDAYDLHGTIYYRAIAWFVDNAYAPTAAAVSVNLP